MPDRPIESVLREYTDRLMAFEGVVGTTQGECDGKPCIKVFVATKASALVQVIPSAIEGYEVEVVESDEIHALGPG
jgi:hypothetical protein